jgi:hypothetical protein
VTPPKSSVKAVWTVAGFGSGKSSGGANAPMLFGETQAALQKPARESNDGRAGRATAKPPGKSVLKKTAKAATAGSSRKARR